MRRGAWKCAAECEAGTPRRLLGKPTVSQVVAHGGAPGLAWLQRLVVRRYASGRGPLPFVSVMESP